MAHAHHHPTTATGPPISFIDGDSLSLSSWPRHSPVIFHIRWRWYLMPATIFADALALFFAWYGVWIARKPSTQRHTFGYHRVGILAALVNAVSLVVIALLIFWEAAGRLGNPRTVHSTPMIVVALIAIAMNTVISLWLRGDAAHDLNVRSAYLHMVGDAISAAGVVVAGLLVAFTRTSIADSIVSILIGVLILWSSWGFCKSLLTSCSNRSRKAWTWLWSSRRLPAWRVFWRCTICMSGRSARVSSRAVATSPWASRAFAAARTFCGR
jgi:hypothetical protein